MRGWLARARPGRAPRGHGRQWHSIEMSPSHPSHGPGAPDSHDVVASSYHVARRHATCHARWRRHVHARVVSCRLTYA